MGLIETFKGMTPEQREVALGQLNDQELQYLNSQLEAIPSAQPEPTFLQERAPQISAIDRAVVKNLAQDGSAGFNYLQKEYPDLEFQKKDDQVFARKRDTNEPFRALDPSGFDMEDITDVGVDIASGLTEAAATTAGAAAGFLGAGPVGAVGGGALAAGTTGAGLEALRQYAGSLAGIEQEVDPTDVAVVGGLSALMAPVGGVGGRAVKSMAPGLTKEIIEGGLLGAGAGGAKRLMSKTAEQATGVRAKVWKNAVDQPKELFQTIDQIGADRYANDKLISTEQTVKNAMRQQGQKLANEITESGQKMDISKAKRVLMDEIENIESKKTLLDADKEKIAALEDVYRKNFTETVTLPNGNTVVSELPDQVDASLAFDIQKNLDDSVDYLSDPFRPQKSSADQLTSSRLLKARGEINKSLKSIDGVETAKQEYKRMANDLDFIRNNLRDKKNVTAEMDPDAFINRGLDKLRKISGDIDKGKKNSYKRLERLDSDYGTDIAQVGDNVASYQVLSTAGVSPQSLQGVTATQRGNLTRMAGISAGILAAQQMGVPTAIGYGAGGLAGMLAGSPLAMKKGMQAAAATQRFTPSAQQLTPAMRATGVYDQIKQSNRDDQ